MHGTCIAMSGQAGLLRGEPGAGKSDLALRILTRFSSPTSEAQALLVSDDQVVLERSGSDILARPPDTIAGKIEVRGVGIVNWPHVADVPLTHIIELVDADDVPRLPPDPLPSDRILGLDIPLTRLAPFEASAPEKFMLVLRGPG